MGVIKSFMEETISALTKGEASLNSFANMLEGRPGVDFPKRIDTSQIGGSKTSVANMTPEQKKARIAELKKRKAKITKGSK